jgi:hypothetical protein
MYQRRDTRRLRNSAANSDARLGVFPAEVYNRLPRFEPTLTNARLLTLSTALSR